MIHTHFNYDPNTCIIRIRNKRISHVRSIKFLGITLDYKLSFSCHIINLF